MTIVENSGKLQGLVDLLRQCEIISSSDDADASIDKPGKGKSKKAQEETQYEGLLNLPDEDVKETVLEGESKHRALIFC